MMWGDWGLGSVVIMDKRTEVVAVAVELVDLGSM